MYRDALAGSKRYQDALEEIRSLRKKTKNIAEAIKDDFRQEFDKLEILKNDIDNDKMLLADAALSEFVKGRAVEITDGNKNRYEPIFSVRFKKI